MESSQIGTVVLDLGRHLLAGSLVLTAAVVLLALAGTLSRSRRLVAGARAGLYGVFVLVAGSSACLVSGFLSGQYDNRYIFNYSERALALPYKLAGLWAGLDGSILFWSLILAGFTAGVAFQHHWSGRHPVGRRLEPWVYVVLGSILFFFLLVTHQVTNPFNTMDLSQRLGQGIPLDPGGHILDGHGLNPQLENLWMAIHPPALYMGFVGFSVPFAFAIASLAARETGDYWIRITRRWTLIAWIFLTNGIILGGLWAYGVLGWGGYWAWDPVENASLLPWLTGTAFLHSIMIQERRDMLKGWNIFLIILTFFMTILGTYMTRSGVVASIHAFAGGSVGTWFLWFMGIAGAGSLFLLAFRWGDLRGKHRLESLLSREAAFYFNNLILVALAAAVLFLSFFPKISHDFLGQKLSVGLPHYNRITTPLFALLLLLKAVGPLIGWVKASAENLRRNFLIPGFLGIAAMALAFVLGRKTVFPNLYPVSILLGLSAFVLATIYVEFHRGIRTRLRYYGENIVQAFVSLFLLNNRRYAGYVVHLGFVLIAIGVVTSGFFGEEARDMTLAPGTPGKLGKHTIVVDAFDPVRDRIPAGSGRPFDTDVARFKIFGPTGVVLADLRPELHRYRKQRNTVSTPAISSDLLLNDYYVHFSGWSEGGRVVFSAFVNPLVKLIWAGWLVMLGGALIAMLPMPGRRVGLAE